MAVRHSPVGPLPCQTRGGRVEHGSFPPPRRFAHDRSHLRRRPLERPRSPGRVPGSLLPEVASAPASGGSTSRWWWWTTRRGRRCGSGCGPRRPDDVRVPLVRGEPRLPPGLQPGLRAERRALRADLEPGSRLLPRRAGALAPALDEAPDAALAGPATWWDRERTLMLNPGYPEDRERIEGDAAAKRAGTWPAHALAWQRRMAEIAFAPKRPGRSTSSPAPACCCAASASTTAGGLFDPALFLYYDDTDLCHRLREHGMPALYVPDAEIVHLFNQSRGTTWRTTWRPRAATSWPATTARRRPTGCWRWRPRRCRRRGTSPPGGCATWGCSRSPPRSPGRRRRGRSLFALGLNPQVVPAAMAFRERPEIGFTEALLATAHPRPVLGPRHRPGVRASARLLEVPGALLCRALQRAMASEIAAGRPA